MPTQSILPIGECPICSELDEVETSFYKYGWDESTPLPSTAFNLENYRDIGSSGSREKIIKRCPHCGTFYYYRTDYEYLVNGTEDEEELTRLTPTAARPYLTGEEYDQLIAFMAEQVSAKHPRTRGYAVRCMVHHYLYQGDSAAVSQYLTHKEKQVVESAVRTLLSLILEDELTAEIANLRGAIAGTVRKRRGKLKDTASYLLKRIDNAR